MTIKAGQIYSCKRIGNFVISNVSKNGEISRIWQDGSVDVADVVLWDGIFIAEYPSWQEAVCSEEFKEMGDELNG